MLMVDAASIFTIQFEDIAAGPHIAALYHGFASLLPGSGVASSVSPGSGAASSPLPGPQPAAAKANMTRTNNRAIRKSILQINTLSILSINLITACEKGYWIGC